MVLGADTPAEEAPVTVFDGEFVESAPPTTRSAGIVNAPTGMALALVDPPAQALAGLAPTIAIAKEAAANVRAPRTRQACRREWLAFEAWCRLHTIPPLPATPAALALYVAHAGTTRKVSGGSVAIAAVAWAHRCARVPIPHRDPAVLDQIEALRRAKGTRPHRKEPLTSDLLKRVVEALGTDLEAVRDRAVLLVGFAGASDAPSSSRAMSPTSRSATRA